MFMNWEARVRTGTPTLCCLLRNTDKPSFISSFVSHRGRQSQRRQVQEDERYLHESAGGARQAAANGASTWHRLTGHRLAWHHPTWHRLTVHRLALLYVAWHRLLEKRQTFCMFSMAFRYVVRFYFVQAHCSCRCAMMSHAPFLVLF